MVGDRKDVHTFNVPDKIKYMWFGGRRHCGKQGQLGCNLLSWWWLISLFVIYSTSVTTLRSCMLMVNHTVDGKDNSMEKTIVVIDFNVGGGVISVISCAVLNHHNISRPSWRKFQPEWHILMSAISLVFSSRLSLPYTVSLTTKSHVLYVLTHVESNKKQPPP